MLHCTLFSFKDLDLNFDDEDDFQLDTPGAVSRSINYICLFICLLICLFCCRMLI